MSTVTEREQFLRAFHDAQPGITSRALARTASYARLAAKVPRGRVLDLGCGDGALLELLGSQAIGVDMSRGELERARERGTSTDTAGTSTSTSTGTAVTSTSTATSTNTSTSIGERVVQARAQALPFADASFDAVTCHLAFMLFDDVELVVAELGRVLKPGAPFIALLGGGPAADGHDAFHHFASLLPRGQGFGDRRASTEAGWREIFAGRAGWRDITFERWLLDLGGSFDDVWQFLGASYQLRDADRVRAALRAAFPGDHVPCTIATYCATATR